MPNGILRQHHALLSVMVQRPDGTWLDLGSEFRELSGIGFESEGDDPIRPGSMAPPESAPSTYTYTEITAQRTLRHGRDSGLIQEIITLKGAPVKGTRQPVDAHGQAGLHRPTAFEGVLNSASESDYDADSNDANTLSLSIGVSKVA
jgi:hypothetical protein